MNATSNEPSFSLSFRAVDPNNLDHRAFSLVQNGDEVSVRTATTFDYETKRFYSFEVQVTDIENGRPGKALVIVRITDINDNTPVITTVDRIYNITESTLPGSTVAGLHATDADDGVNRLVDFTATGGNGQGVFTVTTDGTVLLANHLNTDTETVYQLLVTATDRGEGALSNTATLTFFIHTSAAIMITQDITLAEDQATGVENN